MEIRCRSPPERVEPFLPDHRLVALGQFADKFVALGGPGGLQHLLVSGTPGGPDGCSPITVSRNSTTSWNTME